MTTKKISTKLMLTLLAIGLLSADFTSASCFSRMEEKVNRERAKIDELNKKDNEKNANSKKKEYSDMAKRHSDCGNKIKAGGFKLLSGLLSITSAAGKESSIKKYEVVIKLLEANRPLYSQLENQVGPLYEAIFNHTKDKKGWSKEEFNDFMKKVDGQDKICKLIKTKIKSTTVQYGEYDFIDDAAKIIESILSGKIALASEVSL